MSSPIPRLGRLVKSVISGVNATDTSGVHRVAEGLAGTVLPHDCYILLHHPDPPSEYAPKLNSPLLRALQLKLRLRGVGGIANFCWSEDARATGNEDDGYAATVFAAGKERLDFGRISQQNVEDVVERLSRYTSHPAGATIAKKASDGQLHLYVCTHGARDCRCGETGGAVSSALRAELKRLNELGQLPDGLDVNLGEVAHVGGHRFAANILVFPSGDWLGNARPDDVPSILESILHNCDSSSFSSAVSLSPILRKHWRGRMGLSKEQQLGLAEGTIA